MFVGNFSLSLKSVWWQYCQFCILKKRFVFIHREKWVQHTRVHFRAVQILFSLKSVMCELEVISRLQFQFRFTLRRQNNFEYTLFDAKNSHLIESLNKKRKIDWELINELKITEASLITAISFIYKKVASLTFGCASTYKYSLCFFVFVCRKVHTTNQCSARQG